jgi:hypothetical protein
VSTKAVNWPRGETALVVVLVAVAAVVADAAITKLMAFSISY